MISMMPKWKLLIKTKINSTFNKKSKLKMLNLIIEEDKRRFKWFRKKKTIGKRLHKNKNDIKIKITIFVLSVYLFIANLI